MSGSTVIGLTVSSGSVMRRARTHAHTHTHIEDDIWGGVH